MYVVWTYTYCGRYIPLLFFQAMCIVDVIIASIWKVHN